MLDSLTFTVPGDPVPKGRPRFAKFGKHVTVKTPEKTVYYENLVSMYANDAAESQGWEKVSAGEPVAVEMLFILKMPKSWSKKKKEATNQKSCCKKPDIDNLAKCIDAINQCGIIWHDDNQVSSLQCEKIWAENSSTIITITRL